MAEPYLSDEHRAYLEAHAVDADRELAAGRVRSLVTRDDLAQIPSEWQAGIGRYIPENGASCSSGPARPARSMSSSGRTTTSGP
ncbi:hypothetical protein V2I01_10935 [Micromonospora sp. BRA006-A]|nr:hypothetical protein [Micromonospora sp. BRA006-A]